MTVWIEALRLLNVQFWKAIVSETGFLRNAKKFLLASNVVVRNNFMRGICTNMSPCSGGISDKVNDVYYIFLWDGDCYEIICP